MKNQNWKGRVLKIFRKEKTKKPIERKIGEITLGGELYLTNPLYNVTLKDCYDCEITTLIGEDLIKMVNTDKLAKKHLLLAQVLYSGKEYGKKTIYLDVKADDVVEIIESWKTREKDQCRACGEKLKLEYDVSFLTDAYQVRHNFCRECANEKLKRDIVEMPADHKDKIKEWRDKEILKKGQRIIFMNDNCNCHDDEINQVGICEICGDIMYDYHDNMIVNERYVHFGCLNNMDNLGLLDFAGVAYSDLEKEVRN